MITLWCSISLFCCGQRPKTYKMHHTSAFLHHSKEFPPLGGRVITTCEDVLIKTTSLSDKNHIDSISKMMTSSLNEYLCVYEGLYFRQLVTFSLVAVYLPDRRWRSRWRIASRSFRAYSHQRRAFFSAADISKPHTFKWARWRTTFFRRRNSRCLQNLVRQRVPFKCMGFWYIRSRISAAEKNARLWCE